MKLKLAHVNRRNCAFQEPYILSFCEVSDFNSRNENDIETLKINFIKKKKKPNTTYLQNVYNISIYFKFDSIHIVLII